MQDGKPDKETISFVDDKTVIISLDREMLEYLENPVDREPPTEEQCRTLQDVIMVLRDFMGARLN